MRILAIDDEPDTRRLLRDLLAQAGHHVTAAASAVEALMHLRTRRFDLVLLDLMMPGIDGYELAQLLSGRWDTFEIPVVVVSCRRDEESKSWAKLTGCAGFVEKPFAPADLLEAIGAIEDRRAEKSANES